MELAYGFLIFGLLIGIGAGVVIGVWMMDGKW